MDRSGGKNNSLKQPKEEVNIKYMHRPPTITPNYGFQRRSMLPKSKVSRVLLYDNATQDHMLDIKLAHINIEKERICRIINLHKRSFSHRQLKKQHLKQQLAKSAGAKPNTITKHKATSNKMSKASSLSTGINNINLSTDSQNTVENISGVEESQEIVSFNHNHVLSERATDANENIPEGVKLPSITDNDKRHVIFRVKDTHGKVKVYHTVDDNGILNDFLPMHTLFPKLTDDPRFRSLQDLLVPTYYGNDAEP